MPAVRTGNLVYTAGQLPMVDGELTAAGKVGADVTPEAAKALARVCALNALAAVHSLVGIDSVARVVKVVGFVASAPGFNGQPGVINGASEFLGEVFGEAGAHARSAVGVVGAAAERARRGGTDRRGRMSSERVDGIEHPAYGQLRRSPRPRRCCCATTPA